MNENRSTNRDDAIQKQTSCEGLSENAGPDEQGSECRAIFWYLG